MADVLHRRRWGSRWPRAVAAVVPAGFLLLMAAPAATAQSPTTKGQAAPKKDAGDDAQAKDAAAAAAAPDVAGATDDAHNPAKNRRAAQVEVFKDPNAEAVIDISKLRTLTPAPFSNQDLLRVKEMAQSPNARIDTTLIDRVVRGLAAQLTDRRSIQSLLAGPTTTALPEPGKKKSTAPRKPEGDGGKAIQSATKNLLEPVFTARAARNEVFLRDYSQSLQRHLPQLLKNHLVPRVQAMIVLGEASPPTLEALNLFQSELNNRSQVLWVKLWALQGIANIKKNGKGFAANVEAQAAQTIADFLESERSLPWLIQLRGLEALGYLRQSGLAVAASKARMANTAMLFLAADQARKEVRSEAARTLGRMQVNAVPNFNFPMVAYFAGKVTVDIASEINDLYSAKPARSENPTQARYDVAMLIGPVYEAFYGVQGESNSGLLQTARTDPKATKYVRQVFDLIRPVVQESIELLNSPTKSFGSQKKSLSAAVDALNDFLAKNPPESWALVPGGREFGRAAAGNAAASRGAAPGPAMAGLGRGH